jgi:hypothetical protein
VILIITVLIFSRYFEDSIENFVVKELNQQIRTPVRAEKIEFTLLRKFPDASIRLRNVFIGSVKEDYAEQEFYELNTDTLLYAEEIYLQFKLIPLFKNQYIIQEIQVSKGKLNIYADLEGNDSYKFWKKAETANTSNFRVELKQVKIADINFMNSNLAKKTNITGKLKRLILNGDLTSDKFILDFTLDGKIKQYTSNEINYLSDKEFSAKSKINVAGNNLNIIKSNLIIEELGFTVNGNIINNEENFDLDLEVSGNDLNIENLFKSLAFLFPLKYTSDLKVKGELNLYSEITGPFSSTQIPRINAEFSINDGWMSTQLSNQKFENINLKGYFSNGTRKIAESAILKFENVSVNYGNSKCNGNFQIFNLSHPRVNYQLSAELNIKDLLPFIKSQKLNYHSGIISIDTKIWGSQQKLFNITKNDILNWGFEGTIGLNEIMLDLNNKNISIKHLKGNIDLTNYLFINDLSMVISGNELNIKGRVDNLPEYLFTENAKLWMDLNIYSGNLTVDSFLYNENQEKISHDSAMYTLPDNIHLKSKFWFDKFTYNKFSATNMLGDLIYKPGSFLFNTEFSSMGGNIKGDGFIEQQNDMNYSVRINSEMEKIDIRNLFYCFNNFGQTFIQDKHLIGQLNGTVNFYSLVDPYLNIKKETILAESDVKIINGELINFEPMLGLSNFIEVRELQDIKFSTLENQVFIRNSEVMIPQMDIFSSALNVSGSGIHRFDNQFNYKVNVELSDLLLNNSHKGQLEFEEHIITDDGLNRTKIYLTIEGTPDDYHINYDRKGAVGALKDRLSEEKVELKSLLKEEFGLFRKDTLPAIPEEEKKREFFIRWEESDTNNTDTVKKEKKEKTEKFVIEWDEEEADTIETNSNENKIKK